MTLAQVFVDESYKDEPPGLLVLGGYVYLEKNAKKLSKKWGGILQCEGLEYFRASECAHGNKQFAGMSQKRRSNIQAKLIRIVRGLSEHGFSVVMSQDAYTRLMNPELLRVVGSPYVFAVKCCLGQARRWADRNDFDGDIAYFFEAGHRDEAAASAVMADWFSDPEMKSSFRHFSHDFIDKKASYPLQSGDLIAWHAQKHFMRSVEGSKPRRDFVALIRPNNDSQIIITNDIVNQMIEFLDRVGPENHAKYW